MAPRFGMIIEAGDRCNRGPMGEPTGLPEIRAGACVRRCAGRSCGRSPRRSRTRLRRGALFEVGHIETFGEPAVDRCQELVRFGPPALVEAQSGEAQSGEAQSGEAQSGEAQYAR